MDVTVRLEMMKSLCVNTLNAIQSLHVDCYGDITTIGPYLTDQILDKSDVMSWLNMWSGSHLSGGFMCPLAKYTKEWIVTAMDLLSGREHSYVQFYLESPGLLNVLNKHIKTLRHDLINDAVHLITGSYEEDSIEGTELWSHIVSTGNLYAGILTGTKLGLLITEARYNDARTIMERERNLIYTYDRPNLNDPNPRWISPIRGEVDVPYMTDVLRLVSVILGRVLKGEAAAITIIDDVLPSEYPYLAIKNAGHPSFYHGHSATVRCITGMNLDTSNAIIPDVNPLMTVITPDIVRFSINIDIMNTISGIQHYILNRTDISGYRVMVVSGLVGYYISQCDGSSLVKMITQINRSQFDYASDKPDWETIKPYIHSGGIEIITSVIYEGILLNRNVSLTINLRQNYYANSLIDHIRSRVIKDQSGSLLEVDLWKNYITRFITSPEIMAYVTDMMNNARMYVVEMAVMSIVRYHGMMDGELQPLLAMMESDDMVKSGVTQSILEFMMEQSPSDVDWSVGSPHYNILDGMIRTSEIVDHYGVIPMRKILLEIIRDTSIHDDK